MNLHSRLNQLHTEIGQTHLGRQSATSLNPLQQRLQRIRMSRPANQSSRPDNHHKLASKVGGELRDGYIYKRVAIPLQSNFGSPTNHVKYHVEPLPGEALKAPEEYLYIDTETTGLSGGSGTMVFLYGSARVTSEAIILEQYLLTGYSGEQDMLTNMAQEISCSNTVVSYNGKSFDIPLLQTRYRMHKGNNPFNGLEHTDLLHPVRRLFKEQWSDCRLETVERKLLDIHRVNDLNGSEAPEAWFDYVRYGKEQRLLRIMQHHRQDILSLILLHRKLNNVIKSPVEHNASIYHLAKWLDKYDSNKVIKILEQNRAQLTDNALSLLGWKYRQQHRWTDAVDIWKQLSEKSHQDSIEHLAKYYEHHAKAYKRAYEWSLRLSKSSNSTKRIERLREKMSVNIDFMTSVY